MLSSATLRAGGVAVVRLALGVAFVAGSVVRGLDRGPALIAALAGALVLAMIALGQRSRSDSVEPVRVPETARFDPGWLGVVFACLPSTVGVTAMAAVSLVFSAALAAVLGGVLIALGVLAAVAWVQLAARERREGTRYWVERGPKPRLFVS
jgi:Na+/H+ antiporter NhaD/arsenite permease-like protein